MKENIIGGRNVMNVEELEKKVKELEIEVKKNTTFRTIGYWLWAISGFIGLIVAIQSLASLYQMGGF